MPLEIGSNNLKTPATAIDKIMDYLAVCRLTLERGHQSHLFCHQAPVSISSRTILSVALEIPSRNRGAEREPHTTSLIPANSLARVFEHAKIESPTRPDPESTAAY